MLKPVYFNGDYSNWDGYMVTNPYLKGLNIMFPRYQYEEKKDLSS